MNARRTIDAWVRWPFRRRIVLTGLLLSLPWTIAFSQPDEIQLRSPRGTTIISAPGELLTIPISILNKGTVRDRISLFPRLPDTWRQLTVPPPASLAPGESAVRLVTVAYPRNTHAGEYRIVISATDSTHRRDEHLLPVTVKVTRLVSYQVLLHDSPRFTVAGDAIAYEYEVINTGNDLLTLDLDGRSSLGFPVTITPPLLRLPAGTSAMVRAEVPTAEDYPHRVKHSLVLTAAPAPEGESQSVTTLTDLIPRITSTSPDKFAYPMSGTVRFAGDNDQRGVQVELSGYGSFHQDHRDRFEFLFRTPETQTLTILGIRDEYRARYTRDEHMVYVGDWNYALTTLTEVGRFAFGAGGRTSVSDVTLGGYYNSTRIGEPNRRQVAGFARYNVASDVQTGLNILRRDERSDATIASATVAMRPLSNTDVEIEAARSSAASGSDGAVAAYVRGTLPVGAYDVRFVKAGPNFESYYRDLQVATVSLTGYATTQVRLEMLARDERRNGRGDTLIRSAPRSQFVQFGGSYGTAFSVYYRAGMFADPISASRLDRREDLFLFRAAHNFGNLIVSAYADIGTITDRRLGGSGDTRRYAGSIGWQPLPEVSFNGMLESARTPDILSGASNKRTSGSVALWYAIAQSTRANVSVFRSQSSYLGFTQSYSILEAALEHMFASRHRMSGRVRTSLLSGNASETAFSVEYGMPLALPLGNLETVGVLSGRIIDQQGNGVMGVMVLVGSKAGVSDANGIFAVRDLPPGEHLLDVDRGSLGLDRIVHIPLPMTVSVIGGEETSIVLRTLAPSFLQGNVRRFDDLPTGIRDSVARTDVPIDESVLIAVDISNGDERFRRLTNARGSFSFPDLRPGAWTIAYSAISLPDDHFLERTTEEITLEEGETVDVFLRILPKRRSIRVIQEGGVLKPQR